jgi:4-hydroxyphenylacetate 3-monooxygenase
VEPRSAPTYQIELEDPRLVVAGFTARDDQSLTAHIEELAAHGVAPPPTVPMLWSLPDWLLRRDGRTVQVAGSSTSGEAEPVLIRLGDGSLLVTIGSDHTDRALERSSLRLSKLVCPKVIGQTAWLYEDVMAEWDALRLSSSTGAVDSYQHGSLELLREPGELLDMADAMTPNSGRPLVLFLGTVSLNVDAFSYDAHFAATLTDPGSDRALTCTYAVENVVDPQHEEGAP